MLDLPPRDGYADWLTQRCERELAEVRERVAAFRQGAGASDHEVLHAWNDLDISLRNVLSLVSLLQNVHPDEEVRSAAEGIDQDAHRLLTEITLDRAVYDVLSGVDGE